MSWLLYTDGPISSSAAIDSNGQLYFATGAGTIYQMDAAFVPPSEVVVDSSDNDASVDIEGLDGAV